MFDPHDEKQFSRLLSSMEWSRRRMKPFRENRFEAIREYVGSNFSDDGASKKIYVNLIEQAINIFSRRLAPTNPKVIVRTSKDNLIPSADSLELATNHLLREIRFEDTLRQSVVESMFGIGVVKVGLAAHSSVEIDGFTHDVGQPYADVVALDDWVQDMAATRWDQITFCGNRFRIPLEEAKEIKAFDKKAREDLKASGFGHQNEGGDEHARTISQGRTGREEFKDFVDLWELWLPYDNMLITIAANDDVTGGLVSKPLLVEDWSGPEGGPFHILKFLEVPGSVCGLPFVANLIDLHRLVNSVYRKLARQAERQKDVFVYPGGSEDDARRVVESSDGEAIRSDNPAAVQVQKFSSLDQANLGFAMQSKEFFSELAGNLATIGGLGPSAGTARQEQLINQTSSVRIVDMQARVQKFVSGIVRDLAAIMWYSPFIEIPIVKTVPGAPMLDRMMTWPNPEDEEGILPEDLREGDMFDYDIEIEPHSLIDQPPSAKADAIDSMMQGVFIPSMQMLQEQGKTVDFGAYVKMKAKYQNMPELEDIIIDAENKGPYDPNEPRQSPVTHRTNERINRKGETAAEGAQDVISSLMSGGENQGLNPVSAGGGS